MKDKWCQRKIAILFFLVTIASLYTSITQASEKKGERTPDVLIIYSSGTANGTIREISSGRVNAVTAPTPAKVNCKSIAERLAMALRDKKLFIQISEATKVKHRNQILHARFVVIGSPAYFGNVSWQIKKLFDEQFGQIYALEKERLAQRRIAAFSTAEIPESANNVLKAIGTAVKDCKGRFGPTVIFLTKHSDRELEQRISYFVDEIVKELK